MASLTVASASVAASASSLAGVSIGKATSANVFPVKMAPVRCSAAEQKAEAEGMQRRKMVTLAAAGVLAALASTTGAANAEEPKPGTKEALKKYANICVAQPTASICHG